MTTTATLMEFRSCMMFECKAAEIGLTNAPPKHLIREMTLQQAQLQHPPRDQVVAEHKPPERISDTERDAMMESPASSPCTSMASSPALPIESANASNNIMNGDAHRAYALRVANEPSSEEDSESMPNDLSGYNADQDEMPSPLTQLQCALEKNGLLGKTLNIASYPVSEGDMSAQDEERNGLLLPSMEESNNPYEGCSTKTFKCHLCNYSVNSKLYFDTHMNTHFDHKCPFCDYTSRTEGRLKRHVKDFHSETPPDSWAGTRVPRMETNSGDLSMDESVSSSGNGKPRTYRCKQCDFVALKKNDFWEHNKTHIKAEKLLTCPQCPFVTEYKHHLEYHIRNHFGSKPFKCNKCNYSCVNKSMLNSHMKSHSNVYQYRCSDCSYATKYCHSLKLHLRKYDHKPASVLNVDGTPNPYPIIDVYGTRRGPRPKKSKAMEDVSNLSPTNTQALAISQPTINYSNMPSAVPTSVMYSPQFFNGYQNGIFARPPQALDESGSVHSQRGHHLNMKHNNLLKCILCDFATDGQDMFHKHMLLHAASENPDLIKMYGMNSESLMQLQEHQMAFNNYYQSHRHFRENGIHFRGNGVYAFDHERCADSYNFQDRSPRQLPEKSSSPCGAASSDDTDSSILKNKDSMNGTLNTSSKSEQKLTFPLQYNGYQKSLSDKVCSESGKDAPSSRKSMSPVSSPLHSSNNLSPREVKQEKVPEASPLDLSNAKERSPELNRSAEGESDCPQNCTSHQNSNSAVPSPAVADASGLSSTICVSSRSQPRNRRKGKAFKIDHYIQYEDQIPTNEYSSRYCPETMETEESQECSAEEESSVLKESPSSNPLPQHSPNDCIMSPQEALQQLHRRSPKFLKVEKVGADKTAERSIETRVVRSVSPLSSQPMPPIQSSSDSSEGHKKKSVVVGECYDATAVSSTLTEIRHSSNGSSSPKRDERTRTSENSSDKWTPTFTCSYCDMAFRDCVMYTMHMGYHGFSDPFTCNMCGQQSKDKVDFFLHIARSPHL